MVEQFCGKVVVEQKWWNSTGGTVVVNSNGGTVVVEQLWWNRNGGTVLLE